jgi:hypothetical protein
LPATNAKRLRKGAPATKQSILLALRNEITLIQFSNSQGTERKDRHCERSEAIHKATKRKQQWIASLALAMTS